MSRYHTGQLMFLYMAISYTTLGALNLNSISIKLSLPEMSP